MASYKVTFKGSVAKDLKRLDRLAVRRVLKAVEALEENPFPASSKKLIGSEHTFPDSSWRLSINLYRE